MMEREATVSLMRPKDDSNTLPKEPAKKLPRNPRKPAKNPREDKAESEDSDELVPPPHVTANHVYSSAYRKALSQGSDVEMARSKAMEAAEHFRQNGTVNALCGQFRLRSRSAAAKSGGA